MSLPHFFLDEQLLAQQNDEEFTLELSPDDKKHDRVLRLAPGEHIAVVDAGADYFECQVVNSQPDIVVRISQRGGDFAPVPQVCLVQGVSKGDKMDEVIRHATELGVHSFAPLLCERSVVKLDKQKTANRMNRWRTIAKSAAMQSGRNSIPVIFEPKDAKTISDMLAHFDCIAICWEDERTCSIQQALDDAVLKTGKDRTDLRVAVVVGPEDGFAKHEIDRFRSSNENAFTVSLGPCILRTETAGVVAPALVIYELGGLR